MKEKPVSVTLLDNFQESPKHFFSDARTKPPNVQANNILIDTRFMVQKASSFFFFFFSKIARWYV